MKKDTENQPETITTEEAVEKVMEEATKEGVEGAEAAAQEDTMSYEEIFEAIQQQPWPPVVRYTESSPQMRMTEHDVSWFLSTVLGMKWTDAQGLNVVDKKYLYAKALQVSEMMEHKAQEAEYERLRLQEKFDKKLSGMEVPERIPESHEKDAQRPFSL